MTDGLVGFSCRVELRSPPVKQWWAANLTPPGKYKAVKCDLTDEERKQEMESGIYARKPAKDISLHPNRWTRSILHLSAVATAFVCVGTAAIAPANAQTTVGPTAITLIRTGWNDDSFAIETGNLAISNPANCSTPDAYMSSSGESGYKTHYAATLMAFGMNKPIYIVVSNTECVAQRPKIWGVYVTP